MSASARYVIILIAAFFVSVTGPALADTPSIVGSWKIIEAKGSMSKSNKGQTYNFNTDGTMNISNITKAKYTFDGKVVTLMFSKTMHMQADITFKGKNVLVYKLRNSNQVFTMKRK